MPLDGDPRKHEIPAETKPEVFSLIAIRDWLKTMPPEESYDAETPSICLMGQYAVAQGGSYGPDVYRVGQKTFLAHGLESCSLGEVAFLRPWTFGAALERCNRAIAARVSWRDGG